VARCYFPTAHEACIRKYTRMRFVIVGSVSWAGAPGLGYAGSFPGAPPQDPMGSASAGISRCLLPCSVLRLAPGFSGPGCIFMPNLGPAVWVRRIRKQGGAGGPASNATHHGKQAVYSQVGSSATLPLTPTRRRRPPPSPPQLINHTSCKEARCSLQRRIERCVLLSTIGYRLITMDLSFERRFLVLG
jgi:hypothetical protein